MNNVIFLNSLASINSPCYPPPPQLFLPIAIMLSLYFIFIPLTKLPSPKQRHFLRSAKMILVYFQCKIIWVLLKWVHLVLHPHGIAPTFLKLDSCSPGEGFIPIKSTKGINQTKKIE